MAIHEFVCQDNCVAGIKVPHWHESLACAKSVASKSMRLRLTPTFIYDKLDKYSRLLPFAAGLLVNSLYSAVHRVEAIL